jgi:hypothetical protein
MQAIKRSPISFIWAITKQENTMSVITDLQAVENSLRQEALNLNAQADAIAQVVLELQAIDNVLDAAADAIEVD